MNSIASLPQDGTVDRTLAASYNVLEQAPPPTLREILGAYKAKGDGDRDLLMAMLNAKSAEDQRLASVAALQRTMLEIHQAHSVSATVTESPARAAHPSPLGNSRYDYGMASPGYEHRHLPERSPRSVYRSPPTDAEYNHHPYSSSHRRSHAHQSTREYHPEPHTYSHSTTQS
ncbi:hypothetical protein PUNSTDRAFT_140125, partial [Punctularia strigosozonata HHB-11173 SS5]|uniref:uncharacterized protein n=1 Tax=Punctularia strigosozonata (strain HHB-11173) TaxID=741275 RepID=UPI0004418075